MTILLLIGTRLYVWQVLGFASGLHPVLGPAGIE